MANNISSEALPAHYMSVDLTKAGPRLRRHSMSKRRDRNAVIVRLLSIGVCRSDIKEVAGNRPVRSDFGHEVAGRVVWAADSLSLKSGDLVSFDPHVVVNRSSGFAEYLEAEGDPAQLNGAFPVAPKEMGANRILFCEPMACAHHCTARTLTYLGRSEFNGIRMAILGAGNAAALIALLARHLGADVALYNRHQERLTFLASRHLFQDSCLRLWSDTQTERFDVVIIATAFISDEILTAAVQMVRDEGLVMLYGGTQPGGTLTINGLDMDSVRRYEERVSVDVGAKRIFFGGTYGATAPDFRSVLTLLNGSPTAFPVEKMISETIHLNTLPEVLRNLAEGGRQFWGKIVVLP